MHSRINRLICSPVGLAQISWMALCLTASVTRAGETGTGPTSIAQLRALTRVQMNRGIPFAATGIITMTDTQRKVFVMQDRLSLRRGLS
jgi:hypothetical protein